MVFGHKTNIRLNSIIVDDKKVDVRKCQQKQAKVFKIVNNWNKRTDLVTFLWFLSSKSSWDLDNYKFVWKSKQELENRLRLR